MRLISENTSRKVDTLGRVSIPKSMRDRLRIEVNDEVEIFLLENNDDYYVALKTIKIPEEKDSKYAAAAQVLIDLGLDVPEELEKLI